MELGHIEAFLAIVRAGGFARACSSVHISQPAISRRIRLLERELGAPLFERIGKGVTLTDAGRALLPHAEALLGSMRDGVAAVEELSGTGRGIVTLALVGTLASTPLTQCLRGFREAHPSVDLRLRTALSAEVSDLVRRGDATLGLRYERDSRPELESSIIHMEPLVLVCSPDHRLARSRKVSLSDLSEERWLAFPSRPGSTREPYTSALEQRLASWGLGRAEIVPIDSLTAQKRMVESGFGLAMLPMSSIDEELRAGALHVLHVTGMRVAIPIAMIQRRNAYRSAATKALAALLVAWPEK